MTILSADVANDERFVRCLKARQDGRVTLAYAPPFRTLAQLEQDLEKVELAVQKTTDLGAHELAAYLRDFVGLLKHHHLNPEGLEQALQEFGVADRRQI